MNWEAIGAVGEILGAFAVFVTLLFLIKQLRDNTATSRVNATWTMMQAHNSMHENMVANPEFAATATAAFAGRELTPEQHTQISSMVLHYLNTLVAVDEAYRSNQMSEELWRQMSADKSWTLQGAMRPHLINQLKPMPPELIVRLFDEKILEEVRAAGARTYVEKPGE